MLSTADSAGRRPGGAFYPWDVVFSFPPGQAAAPPRQWIDPAGRPDGEGFTAADFATHVREEFSTYDWIMEGLLGRAGFAIVDRQTPSPTHAGYLCARKG